VRPPPIPLEAFDEILKELNRRRIDVNHYRIKTGDGRSQALGVVNKRCQPPDYSRQNWRRPYLYKLLLDFGAKYVTDISWTSITVNDNYSAGPHRDRGNVGPSFLVGFGDYKGGELQLLEGDLSGNYDIRHKPLVTDFSTTLHAVKPWEGSRYSQVFYQLAAAPFLPPPSVRLVDGKWKFFRGEIQTEGLPHPLRGQKKKKNAE